MLNKPHGQFYLTLSIDRNVTLATFQIRSYTVKFGSLETVSCSCVCDFEENQRRPTVGCRVPFDFVSKVT
jgi:hypothetical protein